MSDVINHRARRRLDEREGGQVCCASFVRACVRACAWRRREGGRGRRGRPPRRGEISISIIESRSIARTPRGAKHVPRSRASGFFPPPFGAYYHLYSRHGSRILDPSSRYTHACYRYIWSWNAIIARRRNQGIGIIVILIGGSCIQYLIPTNYVYRIV